jgi:hypothetical protein
VRGVLECGAEGVEIRAILQSRADCRMQMGPALLPTPLSPARGHPLLLMRPANLPHRLLRGILGARCLAPMRLCLATLFTEIAHRRSRRHPAFASALLRPSQTEALEFSLLYAVAWPRPIPSSDPGLRRIRTCVLFHHPFRPGFRPVRWLSVAPASSSRLALSRSLLHAFSRQARGQEPPPSLGSKLR